MLSFRKPFALFIGALVVALAGCAGDDGESNTDSGGADTSPVISSKEAAQEIVDEFTAAPSALTPPDLSEKPPPGLTVAYVSCPLPVCTTAADEAKQAIDFLGWELNLFVSQFTVEAYVSSWDSALQLEPDFIMAISAQPTDVISSQLSSAKEKGIPVVLVSPGPDTQVGGENPVVASVNGNATVRQYARLQAATVIADADSLEGVVFLYDPSSESYITARDEFTRHIEASGGSVELLEINQEEIGTALPGQVVSFLQANPDTEYIVAPLDSILTGVADAISAVGIDLPKLIGTSAEAEGIGRIAEGKQFAAVQPDGFGDQWNAIDIFARLSVGDTLTDTDPVGNAMIVTAENYELAPETTFDGVPENYTNAWQIDD